MTARLSAAEYSELTAPEKKRGANMVSFVVPGEPVALGRSRSTRSGHHYTPAKSANALAYARLYAQEAMSKEGLSPFAGPLSLELRATFAIPPSWSKKRKAGAFWKQSKPDLDNIVKLIKDSCNQIVFLDDSQVSSITAQKVYGLPVGVMVVVQELPAREVRS